MAVGRCGPEKTTGEMNVHLALVKNNAGSDLLSHTGFPYSGFVYRSPLRGSPAVPADGPFGKLYGR
jgi:hypothetical protein